MNIGELYSSATSAPKEESLGQRHSRLEEEQRLAHLFQVDASKKLNWQEDEVTQKYFRGLEQQRNELIERAIDLAANSHIQTPNTNNFQQIINLLVSANTINKQLTTHLYARTSNDTASK